MLERIAAAVRSLVTRGLVASGAIAGRTVLQVTGLAGEVKGNVELLHPFGWFANPSAGTDLVMLQVLGSRDHMIALGGDRIGQNKPAAPGEFGAAHASGAFVWFQNGGTVTVQDPSGTQLVLQNNGTVLVTGNLVVTGDITDNSLTQGETVRGARAVFNAHTHQVPNVQGGTGTATTDVPTQQEV